MKLKEHLEKRDYRYVWGRVFKLKSERFGVSTFLVSKHPGTTFEQRNRFIDINSNFADAIYYSSVMNDEVIGDFDSLTSYNTDSINIKSKDIKAFPYWLEDPDYLVLSNGWQSKESKKAREFFETRRKKYTHLIMITPNSVGIIEKSKESKK